MAGLRRRSPMTNPFRNSWLTIPSANSVESSLMIASWNCRTEEQSEGKGRRNISNTISKPYKAPLQNSWLTIPSLNSVQSSLMIASWKCRTDQTLNPKL